jgi:hypothetical protein
LISHARPTTRDLSQPVSSGVFGMAHVSYSRVRWVPKSARIAGSRALCTKDVGQSDGLQADSISFAYALLAFTESTKLYARLVWASNMFKR